MGWKGRGGKENDGRDGKKESRKNAGKERKSSPVGWHSVSVYVIVIYDWSVLISVYCIP